MNLALLAAVLLAATPQAHDSALSRRLRLEALDRHAELDLDSSLVLLRAARDADPLSLRTHLEYIGLAKNRLPGGLRELRREYQSLPDSPLTGCLRTYLSVPDENLPRAAPVLLQMEKRGEGRGCPTVLLREIVGHMRPSRIWAQRRQEYQRRAAALVPEAWWLGMDYATALFAAGEFREADATLKGVMRRAGHPLEAVRLNLRMASFYIQRGDSARARALVRAVGAAVARDRRPGVRIVYLLALDEVIGTTNVEGNDLDPVLREWAAVAQRHGAWVYEWLARYTLALRLADRGNPVSALGEYARIVEIADSVGIRKYQVTSRMKRGRALQSLGRLAEAERDLRGAVELAIGAELPYQLAESYHNLAHVYEGAGRLEEASWAVDRFIETIRPLQHSRLRMTAFLDAGEIRWKAGWHAAARRALDSMVVVVDEQDQNHYYAGEHFERLGDFAKAKRYFSQGAAYREQLSLNLAGLVRVYTAIGQLDSAESVARQHDATMTGESDVPLLPERLAQLGDLDKAVELSEAWARKRLGQGNVRSAAIAHLQWARLLIESGRAGAAFPVLQRVDSLTAMNDLIEERIESKRLGGLALAAEGDPVAASKAFEEAARLARQHPTATAILKTHVALAEAQAAAGRPIDAIGTFDLAAKQAYAITRSLEADYDRVRHRDRTMAPFDGAIQTLLAMPDPVESLPLLIEWSQRRKATALALATGGVTGEGPGTTPLTPATVQARLGARQALIDYLVSDSGVAAIVIRPDRIALLRLPLTADSLGRLVRELRRPLTASFNGRIDLARAPFQLNLARSLYQALITPLLPELAGVQRLLIVPDGVLHYVPFPALTLASGVPESGADRYSGARYVVDDYETVYLPSMAFMPGGRSAGRPRLDPASRILAIVYGAPGGEAEVRAIEAVWTGGVVTRLERDRATETATHVNAPDYDVLHFAVHATADDDDPLMSYLRLAPDATSDGLLHLSEIAAHPHTGQLIVLSACETQMGRLYHGEGLMGLARAFLSSGASSVVATQWPVGATAADLMAVFYRYLSSGAEPVTALRAAQLHLRSDPRTAHPFYWAGFVLLESR